MKQIVECDEVSLLPVNAVPTALQKRQPNEKSVHVQTLIATKDHPSHSSLIITANNSMVVITQQSKNVKGGLP